MASRPRSIPSAQKTLRRLSSHHGRRRSTGHLSFFFARRWRRPGQDIASLMIKLANTEIGSVGVHRVRKALSTRDRSRLSEAVALCRAILVAAGAAPREVFVGTLNAGHPGGMMPLDAASANTLHHRSLPDNVYVVDGSLLPRSLGMPPILTIMALSLRVAAACRNRLNV